MPATNLSFAKIVATPTEAAWSQAYNAGSLFIVLSLTSTDEEAQTTLPTIGKQILSNIEAEFFGLEDKTFETIKHAVTQAVKEIPETVILSLSLAYIKEDALYAFVLGAGRITLKRQEKIGTILSETEASPDNVLSASGYLETDDIILLQTLQFAESVPAKTIEQAFDYPLPNDIAETISPHVHGGSEGGATAIVLSFKGAPRVLSEEPQDELPASPRIPEQEHEEPEPIHHQSSAFEKPTLHETEDEAIDEEGEEAGSSILTKLLSLLPHPSLPSLQLDPRKKLALVLGTALLGILIMSIILVQSNREASKNHALFNEIYTSAKKDYDEGEGLISLNESLAQEDYRSAKATLDKGVGKFKPGSKEAEQLAELTELVNKRLGETEDSKAVSTSEVSGDSAPTLKALANDSSLIAATEDEDNIYTLSSKAVSSTTKTSGKKEDLIKNDTTWSQAKSLGVFSGNLYILDQKEGLLKFVPTSDEYQPSTYFKGDAPDLKSAVSMAIDSSIYILFSTGEIQKYTRGTKDSFSVNGIGKKLSSPNTLFTSADIDNIYVLDPGSSRIVKLDKSGKFIAEYQAGILKSAKSLFVSTNEKNAYVLSSGKIYQLGL